MGDHPIQVLNAAIVLLHLCIDVVVTTDFLLLAANDQVLVVSLGVRGSSSVLLDRGAVFCLLLGSSHS